MQTLTPTRLESTNSTITSLKQFGSLMQIFKSNRDSLAKGARVVESQVKSYKVCRPKTDRILKPTLCTTCIHLEALGASKCMHVVHSVGFRVAYLIMDDWVLVNIRPIYAKSRFHQVGFH